MLGSAPDGEPILNPQVMSLYICNNNTEGRGGGSWCLLGKSEIADSSPALAFKFQKNKMFPPCLIVNIVGSLRDRELVCSAVDQQGSISNPLSGGQ